jgi:hypothetical protein
MFMNPMTLHIANITSNLFCHLNIDYYMLIPISALISSRDFHICPEVSAKGRYGPSDDIRADRADMGMGM